MPYTTVDDSLHPPPQKEKKGEKGLEIESNDFGFFFFFLGGSYGSEVRFESCANCANIRELG